MVYTNSCERDVRMEIGFFIGIISCIDIARLEHVPVFRIFRPELFPALWLSSMLASAFHTAPTRGVVASRLFCNN